MYSDTLLVLYNHHYRGRESGFRNHHHLHMVVARRYFLARLRLHILLVLVEVRVLCGPFLRDDLARATLRNEGCLLVWLLVDRL